MRTFIAIELIDAIRNELAQIQARLRYSGADVKWVERENIHLTIRFLGEVREERIEEVSSALDEVARGSRPFEISIKDLGVFPKLEFPRVVWVGLEKGKDESREIAREVDERLERLGFQRESRPFSPHLTIGRVRSPKNKAALKEKLLSTKIEKVLSQKVNSIILFKSELTSQGPIYTKLHESKFQIA
jgi:2'-5' RNA ligase